MAYNPREDDDISLWSEYQAYCLSHPGVPDEYDDWVIDNRLVKRTNRKKKSQRHGDSEEF
jgi:hypothetical protein